MIKIAILLHSRYGFVGKLSERPYRVNAMNPAPKRSTVVPKFAYEAPPQSTTLVDATVATAISFGLYRPCDC